MTILQKYRKVEGELQNMRTVKQILKRSLENMSIYAVKEPRVHAETADQILNRGDLQFASLARPEPLKTVTPSFI